MESFVTMPQLLAIIILIVFIRILVKKCKEEEEKEKSKVWKYIPLLALILGLSAILFQITVLYPLHNNLSVSMNKIIEHFKIR